jgi:hypothetical protein
LGSGTMNAALRSVCLTAVPALLEARRPIAETLGAG